MLLFLYHYKGDADLMNKELDMWCKHYSKTGDANRNFWNDAMDSSPSEDENKQNENAKNCNMQLVIIKMYKN